jgi:hypothetical protein
MATWELYRDGDITDRGTLVNNLIDIKYVDSANPFGDKMVAQIEDDKGVQFSNLEFGTRIELFVTPDGGSEIEKFNGFVVERRETDINGQDAVEITGYTLDQFLRRNDVSNDQSGKLVSEAIQDIIETDTPIFFNSIIIDVVDDFTLQRSLQGERVETALQILSFQSGNEAFYVGEFDIFHFEPREEKSVERGIDNTEWFNYDIPEKGKNAINEVEVRFDDGNRSVVVDNPQQKLTLDAAVQLDGSATQRARINRPLISNLQDAEQEGQRFLRFKNATLIGEVTTFGLFEAEPFDTIDIEVTSAGIDDEFVITEIEYNWAKDETTLSIVENRGFDDDLFVRLEEKTERIDLRESEPEAVETRVISADTAVEIEAINISNLSASTDTTMTNNGVDAIANGWSGGGGLGDLSIVVGDTATNLSRSNTDLANQTASVAATTSISTFDDVSVQNANSFNQTGVREIGIKDSSGNLLTRTVLDSPVSISSDPIEFLLIVNDVTQSDGVVTESGIDLVLDIIADNSPDLADIYAVGDDQTDPTVSDTSLTSQVDQTLLNRTQVQKFDTVSEFSNAIDEFVPSDRPVTVKEPGILTINPVTYITEAENAEFQGALFQNEPDLSNGEGIEIGQGVGNFVEFKFTLNQDVPAGELRVGTYADLRQWDGEIEYSFDGVTYRDVDSNNRTGNNLTEGGFAGVNGSTLQAGTTHTLRVETRIERGGRHIVDAMFAYDQRSRFGITTPAPSAFNGDVYEFPELYPIRGGVTFPIAETRRELTELELIESWNNTDNDALVTLIIGSGGNTAAKSKVVRNPVINANGQVRETFTVSNSDASTKVRAQIVLSRFQDSTDTTIPNDGDGAQEVSFHSLNGNPQAINRSDIGEVEVRTSFGSGTLTGTTLRESGQLSGADLLTHSIFSNVVPENDNIVPVERLTFIPR